jgi:hypothetical protein
MNEREAIETLIYAVFRQNKIEPLYDARYPKLIADLGELFVKHREMLP